MSIKWGILGTSFISEVMAKAIHESELGQLHAIGSRSSAEKFAEEFSVTKFYVNYDQLLSDPDIDAIYIGLPNHVHKDWIIRCTEAGKHILCEKPLVTDMAEAKEIFSMMNGKNIFCMEALMYRAHPMTVKLYELIQDKIIGDIRVINACYMADIASVANPTKGGAILNLGCYPVSLVRLLAGCEPIEMHALGNLDHEHNNDHCASVVLKFPNNILATIATADDIGMYSQFDVYGTRGHLKVLSNPWLPTQDSNKILIQLNDQVNPIEINVTANKSLYTYQIDLVSRSIMNKLNSVDFPGISWVDSVGNIAVLDAWRQQVTTEKIKRT